MVSSFKKELEALKKEIKKANKGDHFANAFGMYFDNQKHLLDEYNKKKLVDEKRLKREEKKQKLRDWKIVQKEKVETEKEKNKELSKKIKDLEKEVAVLVKDTKKMEGPVIKVPSKNKIMHRLMKQKVREIQSGIADEKFSVGIDKIKKVIYK